MERCQNAEIRSERRRSQNLPVPTKPLEWWAVDSAYRVQRLVRVGAAATEDTRVKRRNLGGRLGHNASAFASGTGASCAFISTPGRVDARQVFVKGIETEKPRKLLTFCKASVT